MFPLIASYLTSFWGPFRLLSSYLMLLSAGGVLAAVLTFWILPRMWKHLPHDQGKAFVKGSEKAKGKPTGAGMLMVPVFSLVCLLVIPLSWRFIGILGCLFLCMLTGYLDDKSVKAWGQLKKGLLDALVVILAALFFSGGTETYIWLPFIKGPLPGGAFAVNPWIYVPCAAFLLWLSINAVNCSDGVDALAGSLSLLSILGMGCFLYGITGHANIARYLLVPHYSDGAQWAVMLCTAGGMLGGYLWHNASPSSVMMGDAGSRFLGLLIGLSCLASGNPIIILVVSPILLVNGGTGLVKLLFLRALKKMGFDVRQSLSNVPNPINPKNFATEDEVKKQIAVVRLVHKFRFPVHDQCRKNWNWSDEQILVRFMLLQAVLTPLLLLLFIKLR